MKKNLFKQRLVDGLACYGVISPTTDSVICEYIGWAGMDFYIIDAEHGAISISEASQMIRACESANITPLARINSLDEKMILQYFDAGVMGVMMPGTNTAEDCKKLVDFVKYYPIGKRGLGPVRAADYMAGKMSQAEYISFSNQETLVFPMIETVEAVENLESMCQVNGVDGFILGPRDLALSMGFTDGPAHAEVKAQIDKCISVVNKHKKYFGTVAATAEQAKDLEAVGVHFFLNSVQGLLATGIKNFQTNKK